MTGSVKRLTTVVAERTIRNGTAFDEARVDFNGLRLFTFVDDPVEQHVEGRFTQRIFRLVNGGQRRGKEARVAHVVIADHGNVLRDAQTQLIGRTERAHRHDVAAAEDCRRAMLLAEDLLHGAVAGFIEHQIGNFTQPDIAQLAAPTGELLL